MDVNDLIAMLTEGLDDASKAAITAAANREPVKLKVASLKAQNDYQAIVDKQNQLQAELEGTTEQPGSRKYQQWYNANYKAIQTNYEKIAAFDKKHGAGAFERMSAGEALPTNSGGGPPAMTAAEIQAEVDKRIREGYAPTWSNVLVQTGEVLQKHLLAGRKNPVVFKELEKIAVEKTNGDLEAAYDIWDAPTRKAAEQEATTKEVERRVKEELQKRGTAQNFPAGSDMSTGGNGVFSGRTKGEVDKFDRNALTRDLLQTFVTGEAPDKGGVN